MKISFKAFKFFTAFFITLLVFFLPLQNPKAEWFTFRYNWSRSNSTPFSVGELTPIRWTSENLGKIRFAPITDNQGSIYVTTDKGITKLNPSGQKVWTFWNGSIPSASPVVDDEYNLYYATTDCNPYAYGVTAQGLLKWSYDLRQGTGLCGYNQANGAVSLSPDKKTLYVGIDYAGNSILAFNLDGSIKWRASLGAETPRWSATAVSADGTIFVGTAINGNLFAINPNGTNKWVTGTIPATSISTTFTSNPLLDSEENIYILATTSAYGIHLFSFDSSGKKRWSKQLDITNSVKSLAVDNNAIYLNTIQTIFAFEKSSGNLKWDRTIEGNTLSEVVIDKNGILYATASDKIYALTPNGLIKSTLTLSSGLGSVIIAGDGLVYVYHNPPGTDEGYLYALGQAQPNPKSYPVIFIPGIGGSEIKATQDIIWSKEDGHGGTYSHAYGKDEKIWVNSQEAAKLGDDDYFDVLRLKSDGKISEADLSLTGSLTEFGYLDIDLFFQSLGYEKGRNFFVYPYDWRKDIRETKESLDNLIETAKQQSGIQKVNIVAHSMGGLVARNYIADTEKAQKVNKLINLGVPHLGAVKALKAYIYGVSVSKRIFWIFSLGIASSEVKDLFSNFPSALELLPNKEYFNFYNNSDSLHPFPFIDNRDVDGNKETGTLNFAQTKKLLENLGVNMSVFNDAEQFHDFLTPNLSQNNNVKLYQVVGSGFPTLGQIKEDWLIRWPVKFFPRYEETYINGDDTVPLYSASLKSNSLDLSAEAKTYYLEQNHGDLVKADKPAMQLVKAILEENDNLPTEVKSEKISLEGQHLSVDKDAGLDLYDQSGNHTGLRDGEIENNIPGTFYSTLGNSKNVFIKKNAPRVKVQISSKDEEKISPKIRYYNEDKITKVVIYQNILAPANNKIEFDFNPQTETPPPLTVGDQTIPPSSEVQGSAITDQQPPSTQIQTTGPQDLVSNFIGSVTITFTPNDSQSGVLQTEYSLDNGQTIHTYQGPFAINTPGTVTIQFRSTDKMGNVEMLQTLIIKITPSLVSSDIVSSINNQGSGPSTTPTSNNRTTVTPDTAANDILGKSTQNSLLKSVGEVLDSQIQEAQASPKEIPIQNPKYRDDLGLKLFWFLLAASLLFNLFFLRSYLRKQTPK